MMRNPYPVGYIEIWLSFLSLQMQTDKHLILQFGQKHLEMETKTHCNLNIFNDFAHLAKGHNPQLRMLESLLNNQHSLSLNDKYILELRQIHLANSNRQIHSAIQTNPFKAANHSPHLEMLKCLLQTLRSASSLARFANTLWQGSAAVLSQSQQFLHSLDFTQIFLGLWERPWSRAVLNSINCRQIPDSCEYLYFKLIPSWRCFGGESIIGKFISQLSREPFPPTASPAILMVLQKQAFNINFIKTRKSKVFGRVFFCAHQAWIRSGAFGQKKVTFSFW